MYVVVMGMVGNALSSVGAEMTTEVSLPPNPKELHSTCFKDWLTISWVTGATHASSGCW